MAKKRERLRSVGIASVHFGCLGSWWALGTVPAIFDGLVGLWIPMKVEKMVAPGILDCKAVVADDGPCPPQCRNQADKLSARVVTNGKMGKSSLKDSIGSLEHAAAALSLPLHSTPSTPEKQPSIPLPALAVCPSPLGQPETTSNDHSLSPSSPLLTSLNAELSSAQAVVADLRAQLGSLNETLAASHAHLQANVDELRSRRKEDDHERAELKSRTKTLEEQKRTAEGAKRESEKRLRTAEQARDLVLARIKGMKRDMDRMREKMVKADKGALSQLDDLARHKEEVQQTVGDKNVELKTFEREILRLEAGNDELGIQVKEAEEKLKAVLEYGEQARKLFNATSDDHVHPSLQWGNQAAAAYLPETYGEYAQHYPRSAAYRQPNDLAELTAASLGRLTADVSGFEDFGPAPHEHEQPGSPTGTMSSSFTATDLIPQGLFRSLEGDATPVEIQSYDGDDGSVSDDSEEEFHNASTGDHDHRRQPSHSTVPPTAAPRKWFSPRTNGDLAFHHPSGSSDSLGAAYEASPFAPSASEKKALRWGPISKYRWAGVNRSADDLPTSTSADLATSSTPDLWQQQQDQALQGQGKQPFRFFSLRKPSAGVWN